jgi:hypothetical protein
VKRPTITQLMIQKPAKLAAAEASAKAGCGHEKGPCRGLSHVHHAIAQWLVFTPPHWLGFAPPLTGDGSRSSSDGQRFAVERDSLLSSFYPRYFG